MSLAVSNKTYYPGQDVNLSIAKDNECLICFEDCQQNVIGHFSISSDSHEIVHKVHLECFEEHANTYAEGKDIRKIEHVCLYLDCQKRMSFNPTSDKVLLIVKDIYQPATHKQEEPRSTRNLREEISQLFFKIVKNIFLPALAVLGACACLACAVCILLPTGTFTPLVTWILFTGGPLGVGAIYIAKRISLALE